jgi:hypothetical protein
LNLLLAPDLGSARQKPRRERRFEPRYMRRPVPAFMRAKWTSYRVRNY